MLGGILPGCRVVVWKLHRPVWAWGSLAVGVVVGLELGFGCVAAGRHPFSDTIWSALLTFGLAHLLYYHVLSLPGELQPRPADHFRVAISSASEQSTADHFRP
jgi:hypothetical protein